MEPFPARAYTKINLTARRNCIRRMGEIAFARADYEQAGQFYEVAPPLSRQVG